MRVVVVGGGPVGMCAGMIMARRGADVTVADRDAPPASGTWRRRGVMQFRHPHFFRPIVRQVLLDTLPDVWDALLAAGGIPVTLDGFGPEMTGLQCRRSVFERAVWQVAAREPRLAIRTGHADRLLTERGRVSGVVIDGSTVEADLVIVASGRASRFASDARPPGDASACGFSYVSRMYRARPGAEPPRSAIPMGSFYRGYLAMIFPQDDRTHSALLVRPTADHDLALVRRDDCFDAVAPLIPQLAPWTNPASFEPITGVMAGGGLTNSYRGQLDGDGRVPVPGVFFAGDAVCTTNPAAGRGVSLGLRQVHTLTALLGGRGSDPGDVAAEFDAWCTANIRPWYEDHVYWDATLLRRFVGEDIDLTAPIPSDVVCATAQVDPSIMMAAGPYLGMLALPSVLDPVRERALAVLRTGWRPPWADGPSRDELAGALRQAARRQPRQPAGV